jgi:hypothetical protein
VNTLLTPSADNPAQLRLVGNKDLAGMARTKVMALPLTHVWLIALVLELSTRMESMTDYYLVNGPVADDQRQLS